MPSGWRRLCPRGQSAKGPGEGPEIRSLVTVGQDVLEMLPSVVGQPELGGVFGPQERDDRRGGFKQPILERQPKIIPLSHIRTVGPVKEG